jgi:Zn-dependent metalloprotease
MKHLVKLVMVASSGLLVAACASDDASTSAPQSIFQSMEKGAARQLAETLTMTHMRVVDPSLLAGVDGVRARGVEFDQLGRAHVRLTQTMGGVPVFGGESIAHLDSAGSFVELTDGFARKLDVATKATISRDEAIAIALKSEATAPGNLRNAADLVVLRQTGKDHLAYRVQLDYSSGDQHYRPVVFVSATTGDIVWSYDNLQTAKNREVHNLNHGTSLPGPLARVEGQAPSGDNDVDVNYDKLGGVHDCYKNLYNRDSFDDAGAKLISSVHYSNNYVNAYWDGVQMVYGDGDNIDSRSLAISMDVTAHELTHAVTERTSGLIYSGQSGGLNEAMSDIFGGVCEWYADNNGDTTGPTRRGTYLVGDDIWLADEALRFMMDPARDGASLDFWTSSAGNVDVHYSSGIANLAFYLLAEGGIHPRGKTTNVVTGIGIKDAGAIFYLANAVYLTPSSDYPAARLATERAARDLFGPGSTQLTQLGNAWSAVGVNPPPDYQEIDSQGPLSSNVVGATVNFSYATNGATAMKFQIIAGGTGDADIYVRFGQPPTTSQYDCRPFTASSNETCEANPAQQGTYFVMIRTFSPYTNVTYKAFAATPPPATETECTDGQDNDGDSATDCADSDCAADPACQIPTSETSCTDGQDNDQDGDTDCDDGDCAADPACQPEPETACADGQDNDGDGSTDCADSDCVADPACQIPTTETSCSDGEDNDQDGATDCADSDCVGTPACPAQYSDLLVSNFDSNFAGWVDGGADVARVKDAAFASSGLYSIRIRDDSGDGSSFWTTALDVAGKTDLKVDFSGYATGMDRGKKYHLEVSRDGGPFTTARTFISFTDFNNNVRHNPSVELALGGASTVSVRFRCDALNDSDVVYIDDVRIQAR